MAREAHPRFGFEFDWLAVDRRGHVALMISDGYGPVPLAVLDHPDQVDDAVDALPDTLPAVRGAPAPDHAPSSDAVDDARVRGLFVYAWKIYNGPYERLAAPEVAVTIDALPAELGSVARLGPLEVEFAHDDEIRFPYVDAHTLHTAGEASSPEGDDRADGDVPRNG